MSPQRRRGTREGAHCPPPRAGALGPLQGTGRDPLSFNKGRTGRWFGKETWTASQATVLLLPLLTNQQELPEDLGAEGSTLIDPGIDW